MTLEAVRYDDGTVACPAHPLGPDGAEPIERIDLSDRTATVVTWTESTATPPGVRQPNTIAIVEFELDEGSVRVIGQTSEDVEVGDHVTPVYCERLRDPDAGIREPDSQAWDGYRFEPV